MKVNELAVFSNGIKIFDSSIKPEEVCLADILRDNVKCYSFRRFCQVKCGISFFLRMTKFSYDSRLVKRSCCHWADLEKACDKFDHLASTDDRYRYFSDGCAAAVRLVKEAIRKHKEEV